MAKATATGKLLFYPGSIENIHFEGTTPVMRLGIVAQNTSNQALTFNSLAASLTANGTLIGNIGAFAPQAVMPNSQQIIYIDVRLSLIGIVNDIIRDVQYGNFSQDIVVSGFANVENYQVPLQMTFKAG